MLVFSWLKKSFYATFSLSDKLGYPRGKVYNGGGHIVPIATIYDNIYLVLPFLENEFRIGGVFHHFVFVIDRGRDNRIAQFLYQSTGHGNIRYANPYCFFLFELLRQVVIPRQYKGISTR